MPTIAEMLAKTDLEALAAKITADEPASTKVRVTKQATDPNPPSLPRTSAEVDIDPESEAMIDALCFECSARIKVDPQLPEGVDPEQVRKFLCPTHGEQAMRDAIEAQRNVEVIRRARVAKHQPRTDDGIEHPVTTTHKEMPVQPEIKFDLNNVSDAELGAMVRAKMLQRQAAQMEPHREMAKIAQQAREDLISRGIKGEQVRRKGHILPGFKVGNSMEVPTLDLSAVPNLDEQPSGVTCGPYNKARFLLAGESALPVPDKDGLLPEGATYSTTYRVLEKEHERLRALATIGRSETSVGPPTGPAEPEVAEVVIAATEPQDHASTIARLEAMVAALRD